MNNFVRTQSKRTKLHIVGLGLLVFAFLWACSESQPPANMSVAIRFVDQLPNSVQWSDQFQIDIGSKSARGFLVKGWSHDEGNEKYSWAWAEGNEAWIKFKLYRPNGDGDYELNFHAWPIKFAGTTQKVKISINGLVQQDLILSAQPTNYSVIVAGSALLDGENFIQLEFQHAISPSEHKQESRDTRRLAAALSQLSLLPHGSSNKQNSRRRSVPVDQDIVQPAGSIIQFPLDVPASAVLTTRIRFTEENAPVRVGIRISKEGESSAPIELINLTPGGNTAVKVRLSDYVAQSVLIDFVVEAGRSSVIWEEPLITVPGGASPSCKTEQPCQTVVRNDRDQSLNLRKPFLAPGLKYETLFEGGVIVALDKHEDAIFSGDKQTGIVQVYRPGLEGTVQVVDFEVDGFNERGLLGIALHPDYPQKPFLYAYYSTSVTPGQGDSYEKGDVSNGNRLVRLTLKDEVAIKEEVLHEYEAHPTGYHNGGNLRFDADKTLWVGIGDTLRLERAQDTSLPQGKLHRYQDDGTAHSENHFAMDSDSETLGSIYAYGLRNPWNFAFHPTKKTVYSVDIGHDIGDEINVIEAGGNYGWPEVEGMADGWRETEFARRTPNYRNPIWESGLKSTCPSGIAVAIGQLALERHLVWSDCNRPWRIQVASLSGLKDQYLGGDPVDLVRMHGRPVNMIWDGEGGLLVSTMSADAYEAKGSVRHLTVENPELLQAYVNSYQSGQLQRKTDESWQDFGLRIYEEKGCVNCHSIDGTPRSGPTFSGIFDSQRELEGGGAVLVDHGYIVESLLKPSVKLVRGFPALMPSYDGKLTEEQVLGLSHFIKSVR